MVLDLRRIRPPVNIKEAVPGIRGAGRGTNRTSNGKTRTTAKKSEK